jgi:exocyst complex component 6
MSKMTVLHPKEVSDVSVDPLNNERISIDFQPLYEAIHIYNCLNKGDELRESYEADRRGQMNLLLPSDINLDDGGKYLRILLANITGFSIIERATTARTQNFRSVSEIEALWDIMCSGVIDLVTETVERLTQPRTILTVKDAMMLFMQTIQVYQIKEILTLAIRFLSHSIRSICFDFIPIVF